MRACFKELISFILMRAHTAKCMPCTCLGLNWDDLTNRLNRLTRVLTLTVHSFKA